MSSSIILGIDPGTATTGFGLIKKEKGKMFLLDYGCITTSADLGLPERLKQIVDDLRVLLKEYKPEVCAVEKIFFAKNTKTALNVAQARGAIVHAVYEAGIPIFEYTPLQIKEAVTSYGRATKDQIKQMVKAILNLKFLPQPDDAADALAAAICCGNTGVRE